MKPENTGVAYLVFDIEAVADGRLVSDLKYPGQGLMPADATPLPDVEMELIRRWIAEGAPNN